MPRILCLDYGRKRIGIAVTDNNQIIATGLTTVNTNEIWTFLNDYTKRETVEKFVVGNPKQMNNQPSESMIYVKPFVEQLHTKFPTIPIEMYDERFTSKMAFQTMIDSGINKKARQNKALVDQISATIILQSYLESNQK